MSCSIKVPARTALSLLLAGAVCGLAQAGGAGNPAPRASMTDRLIVKYKEVAEGRVALGQSDLVAQRVAGAFGLKMSELKTNALGAKVFQLSRWTPEADLQTLARQLMLDDANVEYAEPDRLMHAQLTPNDTNYGSLWGLSSTTAGVRANVAWDTHNGAGVTVAVLDTGIRPHVDLAANIVAGYDMIADTFVSNDGNGRDSDPSDPGDWNTANQCAQGDPAANSSWHGTHVAGTIAAVGNNNRGVIGVAYGAKVQAVRVLGRCGGYTSDIADGMIWASGGTVSGLPANATPAKVLNLSLGGSGACDTTSQSAINSARSRGATVVVAAGNSNVNVSNASPANCSGVIAVASVGPTGGKAYYSNFGSLVDVAAPGGDTSGGSANGILSTLNAGTTTPGADNYAYYQGTSMATPHVAGVVALMYQAKPAATPDEIETALKTSTRAFPATCSQCGTGIVDAPAAIAKLLNPGGGGGSGTTMNESESNNTRGTADPVATANTTVNGALSTTSDTDYFLVNLPAGKTLTATLNPGTRDYDLYIYNSSGTQLASSTKGAGQIDSATSANTGSRSSVRYVRVRYYSGGTGSYTLNLNW
ncbi:MAG: S8 family serine peptidase [Burkholderiales bacterium]|nr:S8 family serine peptidase [Burkholderiales bacterium]